MVVQGANGPALDAVTSGSKGIVFGGVDYSAYAAQSKGEPLEVIIPSSGTTVTPRPVMILSSSDNPDAAAAFVDFMFSEQGQSISADRYMIPALSDIDPVASEPLSAISQLSEDWDEIVSVSGDIREKFVQRYL